MGWTCGPKTTPMGNDVVAVWRGAVHGQPEERYAWSSRCRTAQERVGPRRRGLVEMAVDTIRSSALPPARCLQRVASGALPPARCLQRVASGALPPARSPLPGSPALLQGLP